MKAPTKLRGRKPGSLLRSTCCICSAIEMSMGGGKFYRCAACKAAGILSDRARRSDMLGKDAAIGAIQVEIRRGRLIHPTQLSCVDCQGPAAQYEHRDYNKPLVVQPVCRSCNLRRGPAMPLPGSLERCISKGRVPYRLRVRAMQLFKLMGVEPQALLSMPKTLTLDHWRALLSEIAAARE